MIRRFDAFFAALVLAAAVPAGGALAQNYPAYPPNYSPPPNYRGAPPPYARDFGPPPGAYLDDDDDEPVVRRRNQPPPRNYQNPQQAQQPRGPNVIPAYPEEADARLPSPGFAQPDGRVAPGYGHQMDTQPPGAIEGQPPPRPPGVIGATPPKPAPAGPTLASLPPDDQPEVGPPKELSPELKRQLVDFQTKEPAGTLIIDTPNTFLYLVLGNGKAIRYGIGVGRDGFTWAGAERVSKMTEWPDWHPPAEMIERQPYLPRFMAGGEGNPLGARALYLGKTLYRIHGTNQPSTIGQFVSSGCIRLLNSDIEDLYNRVQVGSRVVVLPSENKAPATALNTPAGPQPAGGPRDISPPGSISGSPLPPIR
ncbi:MAG: L,D-transpeptidase family protein [Hyphomicrobiales bacterium]